MILQWWSVCVHACLRVYLCVHTPVHISLAGESIAFIRFSKESMTFQGSEPITKLLQLWDL